jgi:hypothetical protein
MLLSHHTRRREFITLVGSAAAWPLAARAQQPAMPVIGFISSVSPGAYVENQAAFRRGLGQTGFIDGQTSYSNITGRRAIMTACQRWRPN